MKTFFVFFFFFFSLFSQTAFSAMGDHPDPDASLFREKGLYLVYIRTASQVKILEYFYNGAVFAASWHGSRMPDLKKLFGSRYQDYESKHQKGSFRNESVQAGDMIVHTGGHMRAVFGLAFIPALAPPGFTLEDVQ